MEFGNSFVQFNILDAMKHPVQENFVLHLDVIDDLVEEVHDTLYEEFPKLIGFGDLADCFSCDDVELCAKCAEMDEYLMRMLLLVLILQ